LKLRVISFLLVGVCLLRGPVRLSSQIAGRAGAVKSTGAKSAAGKAAEDECPRPHEGETVGEPADLRSVNGVLKVELTFHNVAEPDGTTRYCYVDGAGNESPTLRLKPGDLLILHLKNELRELKSTSAGAVNAGAGKSQAPMQGMESASAGGENTKPAKAKQGDGCGGGMMTEVSTNLHFHGLTVPPVCHQDDVLKTSVEPGADFEYKFRIPADEAPGLYWYHPHIHGYSKVQVLGGASGALIIEGIERAEKAAAGLPERVLVIRDQDLMHPNAPPAKSEPVVGKMFIDRDGDAVNTGTGFGKPAKDLSVNFVPVPYPDYPPAVIAMRPGERQLWRVLNASAITYLNLEVLFNHKPQRLGLVALDGVPLNTALNPGAAGASDFVDWQTHLGVPPGARVEFIVEGPPAGVDALLVTRTVDTGPGGENDPNRALAKIVAAEDAPELGRKLAASPEPLAAPELPWLGSVAPERVRRLYFSEKLLDPNDPNGAIEYYLTVDGETPQMFDMKSGMVNITVKQGTVEDWIIENRSNELHDFHIHQLHFLLLDYMGRAVNEPFLRDTINVPYYDGRAMVYPSVRLRMDFRDPNMVGTFVYHCHLLEHEDGGMMGTIRVEPGDVSKNGAADATVKQKP
jgi:FtsP/CotA-like multicopper oxidase with cupredoxin domain